MEGKKAFILPAAAALVLLALWLLKPSTDDAAPPDSLEAVIDRELGGAVHTCLAATPDAQVRSVVAVISGPPGGNAVVEQLAFEPAELPPALRSCLLDRVGAELPAPAPASPMRRSLIAAP